MPSERAIAPAAASGARGMWSGARARGVHQHQRGDALRMGEREAQREHAAHRMAEQIAARDIERVEQAA